MAWVIGAIAALIILAGGSVWYATQQATVEQTAPVQAPISNQEAAVLPAVPVGSPTPVAQAPTVETAELAAVGVYKGSGTATRSFDGATFAHTVTATLGDPATGKFYEGWLVVKTGSGPKFFSTGKLAKQGAKYTLSYTATQNYPDHSDAVITEETLNQGLDDKPEAHVLEGSFKKAI